MADSWLGSHSLFSDRSSEQQPVYHSGISQLYSEQLKDISVKPLNFQQDEPPKHTAEGQRAGLYFRNQPLPRYSADPQGLFKNPRNHLSNRVLLSSQGGRTIKALAKHLYNPTFLLGNFDLSESKLREQYDRLVKYFEQWNLRAQELPFNVNMFETKEILEHKAIRYIESKIDTKSLVVQLPEQDWEEERLKRYFVDYQPSSAELSHKMITEQPTVALKKYKNCLYFGGMKGNRKEGYGVLIHFSGKRYQGEFKDDLKTQGVQITSTQFYIGKFTRGQRQGPGLLRTTTHLHCGQFTCNLFSNLGLTLTPNLAIFQYHKSICVVKTPTNDIYVGEQVNGEKHGFGVERFNNQEMYIGSYEGNQPEGYGEYYWANGAIYRGEFARGLRHGDGNWAMRDGDQYEGTYGNDKKEGEGVYRWKNGTFYKGSFENDYRHGYGEMFWADGRVYKGLWTNGIENIKKIPTKRLKGYSRSISVTKKDKSKLPKVHNRKQSLQMQTLNALGHGNKTWRMSNKQLPKGGIKAIFNPSYNFEY